MAKKRKKKNNNNVFLALGATVVFVISAICLFINNGVKWLKGGEIIGIKFNSQYISISKITFGSENALDFSFVGLILVILVFAALAMAVLTILKPDNKIFPLVGTLAGIAAGIMFFCVNQFAVSSLTGDMFKCGSLGFGAIFGGITCILGGLCLAGSALVKK